PFPPQETEYSVPWGGTSPPSIPNLFQRYPIYLTLHKILDGTAYSYLVIFLLILPQQVEKSFFIFG
ncbi:hypothetical protein, partial [Parageobacillus thermoglucosidasius]|uniref:hypothetical protein n=1 Tax=Parageobacillus thermoglucosidasius TaxID=1426 RepID=UPI0005F7F874